MAFWSTDRQPKQSSSPPVRLVARRLPIANPGSALYWLVLGVAGISLGLLTLGIAIAPSPLTPLFVLALLCAFVAMIVGDVRRLFLGLLILDIPLKLDFNLTYRPELAELNAIAGLNVSLTTVALLVLYMLWLGVLLGGPKDRLRPQIWTPPSLALAAYIAVVAVSLVVASDVMLSMFELFLLVQMFLVYIYIIGTVRTRQDVVFVVVMLFIAVFLASLIVIGLRFVGHSISIGGLYARIDQGTRVGGTVGSPNTAASYLTLFLAPAFAALLARLGTRHKSLSALVFGLGMVALIFTLSRGGWIAFILSMAILYLLTWRRGQISLLAPLVALSGVLIVALLFQNTVAARLSDSDASSAEGRLYMIRLAWKIIQDHPILGIGANNFAIAIPRYATPDFSGAWLHVVHNKYLLVWSETGIIGLIAFLLFLAATLHRGWRCWRLNDPLLSPLALGFTAAIVGQMGHMFLDIFHSRSQVQSLWIVAGLIGAMYNICCVRSTALQNEPSRAKGRFHEKI